MDIDLTAAPEKLCPTLIKIIQERDNLHVDVTGILGVYHFSIFGRKSL